MVKTNYGKRCKLWRVLHTSFTQKRIASDLDCTISLVSKFESGKADNMDILVWYIEHGMPLENILEGSEV